MPEPTTAAAATRNTPAAQRVLVVEDDPAIASAVAARLHSEGFVVETCADGFVAVERAIANVPDLVILDLMLPGLHGHEVCRRIQQAVPVPVLMVTALGEETDRVVGLALGADDYLVKPFSMRELVARVRAILRRVERASGRPLPAGPMEFSTAAGVLRLDLEKRRVESDGELVELTPTEFDLLCALAARPGVVRSREQLLAEVWGYRDGSGARTVDSHVRAVRRKVGEAWIRTVHGVGYALCDVPPAAL